VQIGEIRAHLDRASTFRGYRSATVGLSGLLALAAAAVQPHWAGAGPVDVIQYLVLWVGVAAVAMAVVGVELAARYVRNPSLLERQRTIAAVEQFVPCVAAGAGLTFAVVTYWPDAAPMLPGLWCAVFTLGVFASCRQLLPAFRWIGASHMAAGLACLAWARGPHAFSPWAMGGAFGIGQLLASAALYWTLERKHGTL
jgi:hypothetical protein